MRWTPYQTPYRRIPDIGMHQKKEKENFREVISMEEYLTKRQKIREKERKKTKKEATENQLCLDVGRGLCLIARIIIVLIIPVCNLICEGICI